MNIHHFVIIAALLVTRRTSNKTMLSSQSPVNNSAAQCVYQFLLFSRVTCRPLSKMRRLLKEVVTGSITASLGVAEAHSIKSYMAVLAGCYRLAVASGTTGCTTNIPYSPLLGPAIFPWCTPIPVQTVVHCIVLMTD